MEIKGVAKLLRIFIGESDHIHGKPLYEAIVYAAKENGLAGATVFKGRMAYGANSKIHTSKVLALSDDLPMIIEIVDQEEKINSFLSKIDLLFEDANSGGLVTMEKVDIIKYIPSKNNGY